MIISQSTIAQYTTPNPTPSINLFIYRNAFGVRIGETSGLTYNHIFGGGNAVEGILDFSPYTVGITGLYEKYLNTGVAGLNLYLGGGAHINSGNNRTRTYYFYRGVQYVYVDQPNYSAVGVDGIVGIEYKFKPVPIALSLDVKPYFEGGNYGYNYFAVDPGVGFKIKY